MVVLSMAGGDDTAPTLPADSAELPAFEGGKVGRYLLVREIGRGAMGQVFAGFDPDLGRRVAVKLVGDARDALAPYLLREARMLATLSHPNIVPVFDVGEDGDRLFIVMELVDGVSLASWLDEARRSPREIVRAWCAAGRGLAAAHAAGVAHRDVKAANMLIGKDGHVRVADFGLARTISDPASESHPVEGTRGYMAPEAFEQGVASEAVDQYAFCVSLWRALTGVYPADGGDVAAAKLPRRLRRALERGLRDDPAARWPSIAALVDELERRPHTAWYAAGAAGALVIAGAGWLALRGGDQPACESGAAAVQRAVPAAKRAALVRSLRDSAVPHADALALVVDRLVGDALVAWSAAHDAACGAPARVACLDARLGELTLDIDDAIVEHADAALLDVPVQLTAWRSDLPLCATAAPAPGESGAYRHAMARSLALFRLGRSREAIAAADVALAVARDAPARVRAQARRIGVDEAPDVRTFEPLYAAARATGDRELPAEVALVAAEGCTNRAQPNCGDLWVDRLAEALAALPPDAAPQLRADLVGLRGDLAMRDGNPAVALALYADEVRRISALRGEDSLALAPGFSALSGAHLDLKHYDEAIATASRADAIVVRWLGEEHPYRVAALVNRGGAKLRADDIAGGIADLEHALALRVQLEGADSPRLAGIYNNLAAGYQAEGKPALALPLIDRSIAQAARGPELNSGRQINLVRNGAMLAGILARRDARARIDSAFALAQQRHLADEHPDWALLYSTRGTIALRTADLATAARDLPEAAARYERLGERMWAEQALAHGALAQLALAQHRIPTAARELARAQELGAPFTEASNKRAWLATLAVELAIAKHDRAAAQRQLAPLLAFVAAGHVSGEPRLAAHIHLLAAVLAADPAAEAAAREAAAAILRAADIPEDAAVADCPICASAPGLLRSNRHESP
jgi:eukaryotic-like serine/threonine-protein kinase